MHTTPRILLPPGNISNGVCTIIVPRQIIDSASCVGNLILYFYINKCSGGIIHSTSQFQYCRSRVNPLEENCSASFTCNVIERFKQIPHTNTLTEARCIAHFCVNDTHISEIIEVRDLCALATVLHPHLLFIHNTFILKNK